MPAFTSAPLFCFENLLDTVAAVIASPDEIAAKPASRLADPKLGRKFRTTNWASEAEFKTVTFDLLANRVLQVFSLIGVNFTSATSVEVTAGTDPTFVTNVLGPLEVGARCLTTWPNGGRPRNKFVYLHSDSIGSRYVRFRIRGGNADGFYEASRAYLGPGFQLALPGSVSHGFQLLSDDATENIDSDSDETMRRARASGRAARITLEAMSEDDAVKKMYASLDLALGASRDWLYLHHPSTGDDTLFQLYSIWGYSPEREGISNADFEIHNRAITLRERK